MKIYVGIDVCKANLDVYVHPVGEHKIFSNDKKGHKNLNKYLEKYEPEMIVIEATGKLHKAAWRAMVNEGLKVSVINPRRARQFAASLGLLAKTDKIDAMGLAKSAEALQLKTTQIPTETEEKLAEFLSLRNQLTQQMVQVKNMLKSHSEPSIVRMFKQQMLLLEKQRAKVDETMLELIEADEVLSRKYEILMSIKGIGKMSASMLIAHLPELGKCDEKQIASLIGVVPFNRDSGNMRGKRYISGGRKAVRDMLYMAAVSASRHNNDMNAFYKRLTQKGKSAKLALTAIIRKIVILANALIKNNRLWEEIYA